ncbi:MAG: hypothetical protein IIT97_01830 [Mycoplasmataceae bacterium]|nr:hypothetical protein [Mycoplasmataceae bacterium]
MENKDTELVEKDHSIEVVPDEEANKETNDLEKRLNVTVIDPTLPIVEYKIVKKYDLQPTKTFVKTITTPVTTNNSEPKNRNNTLPIDLTFDNSSSKTPPIKVVNKHIVVSNEKTNWFIYSFLLLLVVTITCMCVYGLIDAIVVFSQWNLSIQNNLFPDVTYLHFVETLKPTFLYQYFFTGPGGKVTLGPTANANETLSAATAYAATASNVSVGGFGLVSAARFFHAEGIVPASDIMNSSLSHDLALPSIIQVIYSLIGILIVVLLIFVPPRTHWSTIIMIIFACSFIII